MKEIITNRLIVDEIILDGQLVQATGPTGPAGATGADGQTGATGADGAVGATGADGAVGATGQTGADGIPGFEYRYDKVDLDQNPGAGYFEFDNNTDITTVANIYINVTSLLGQDVTSPFENLLSNSLLQFSNADGSNLAVFLVQETPTLTSGVLAMPVIMYGSSTGNLFDHNEIVGVQLMPAGANGAIGATGADGITGPTGDVGPTGADGQTGQTGAPGATGADGIVGPTGADGQTGVTGATGLSSGAIYYLNHNTSSSDISGYFQASRVPDGGSESIQNTIVTSTDGELLVANFATEAGDPDSIPVPMGTWDFHIYADVDDLSDPTTVAVGIYKRDTGGTETLLFQSADALIPSTTTSEIVFSYVIGADILIDPTDRIVYRVTTATGSLGNRSVNVYFDDTVHCSRVNTTLSQYFTIPGATGATGADGQTGADGATGPLSYQGYVYQFSALTDGTPAVGGFEFDAAPVVSNTGSMYINNIDFNGDDLSDVLTNLFSFQSSLTFLSEDQSTRLIAMVNGPANNNGGGIYQVPLIYFSLEGSLSDTVLYGMTLATAGAIGQTGATGADGIVGPTGADGAVGATGNDGATGASGVSPLAGFVWAFDTNVDGSVSAGYFQYDNVAVTDVANIFFNSQNASNTLDQVLANLLPNTLILLSNLDGSKSSVFRVNAATVNNSGVWTVPVTFQDTNNNSPYAENDLVGVEFSPAGADGAVGPTGADGAVGATGLTGLAGYGYSYSNAVAGTPAPLTFEFDNVDPTVAVTMYFGAVNDGGQSSAIVNQLLFAGLGSSILVNTQTAQFQFQIQGAASWDTGAGVVTVAIALEGGEIGTLNNGDAAGVQIMSIGGVTGATGADGTDGAVGATGLNGYSGLPYMYDASLSGTPASGYFQLSTSNAAGASNLYVNDSMLTSISIANQMVSLIPGSFLYFTALDNSQEMSYEVTSAPVVTTGVWTIGVSPVGDSGVLVDQTQYGLQLSFQGAAGATGADGAVGATGPTGADGAQGIQYLFDTGTDGIAATGHIQLDNSDPTLTANLYVNGISNENGVDVSSVIESLTALSFITITAVNSAQGCYVYQVNGGLTVVGAVIQIPVAYVSGSGTILAAEQELGVQFQVRGVDGAVGATGADGATGPTGADLSSTQVIAIQGTNIDITNPGITSADGATLGSGNAIALVNQTDPTENGLWVYTDSTTALTRLAGWDTSAGFTPGRLFVAQVGTVYGGSVWQVVETTPTLGTDSVVFTQTSLPTAPSGSQVRFFDAANDNFVGINAGSLSNSYTLVLPGDTGEHAESVLRSNGGNLAWAEAPYIVSFTLAYTNFAAAANSNELVLLAIDPGTVVDHVVIYHNQSFTGGAISAYTISVGVSGTDDKYASAWDVFQAPATNLLQISTSEGIEDMSSSINIVAQAVSTGDTLDQATQGSVTIYMRLSRLF